jgi:hypothetical protein
MSISKLVLLLALYPILCCSTWHAYNSNKDYASCENRDKWNVPKTLTREVIEKYKLWPQVTSSYDQTHGETLYGLELGLEAIWKNQHPEDCSKAKFLISGGFESGFGSEFHVLGAGLALAMSLGRVYVMLEHQGDSSLNDKVHSLNDFQINTEFCRKQGKLSLDCYYEPWSSCTLEDALQGTTLQTLRLQGLHMNFMDIKRRPHDRERALIVQLSPELIDDIPPQLAQVVACSPMDVSKYKYWWRAVSAAYLLRPNEPTRQLIMQHRQDQEMRFNKETQQCVSVHIRRGDKHLEMKIIEDERVFFETAQVLWDRMKNDTGGPISPGAAPIMFIGSEDAGAVDNAIAWGKDHSWDVKYTNLFDRRAVSTGLNNEQQQEARKKNEFKHHEWEYFNMILTLDGHLRCSAFVCTQRSNYCRVIDEMRATVGNKANRDYADFSCNGGPPACISTPQIGIGW